MDEKYLSDLWNWTNSQDPTFKDKYTFDSWSKKLNSNDNYKKQFYGWVSGMDETFQERRPYDAWSKMVSSGDKKKEESALPLDQGSTLSATPGTGQVGLSGFTRSSRGNEVLPGAVEPQVQREVAQAPVVQTISKKQRQEAKAEFQPSLSLYSGVERMYGNIAGVIPTIYDFSAEIQNDMANVFGADWLRTSYSEDVPILKDIRELQGKFNEHAEYYKERQRKYDEDISTSISKGSYNDALQQVVSGGLESLPDMALSALSGAGALKSGLAVLGTTQAVNRYEEIKDNKDMSGTAKVMDSSLTGMAEAIFESIFGTAQSAKIFKEIIEKEGKEKATTIIKKSVNEFYETAAKKYPLLITPIGEGFSELGTQVTQNLIAKHSGEDPERNIMEGAADAFILGSAIGGGFGAVNATAKQVASSRVKKEINNSVSKISELNYIINNTPDIPEDVKESLTKLRDNITENVKTSLTNIDSKFSKLNEEQKTEFIGLKRRLNDIGREYESTENETIKTALELEAKEVAGKIKKYAVQEQTTSEVPVQPETAVGEETTQAGPEVVTEEEEVAAEEQIDLFKLGDTEYELGDDGKWYNAETLEEIDEDTTGRVKSEAKPSKKIPKRGSKGAIAGVKVTYPTMQEARERKAARNESKYVEESSENLEEENTEVLAEELQGEFGILTAENPMAQPLTEEENRQLNEKAEEFLKEKGYKPRRVTGKYGQAENSFFVKGLTKEDAIAFAKKFSQDSVAHSEGLVYQDGAMNPRVKSEDSFAFEGFTPESNFVSVIKTKDGLKTFKIGYDFDTKTTPTTTETGQQQTVAAEQGTPTTIEGTGLRENIKKSIAKVFKKFEVKSFKNAKEMAAYAKATYNQETGANDAARVFAGENGVEVLVNEELSDDTALGHEVWHALLLKAFGDNQKQFAAFRGAINKTLRENGYEDIADSLDEFSSQYTEEGEVPAEEYLAQLGGLMTSANIDLKNLKPAQRTLLEQIKDIINEFAVKLTGQPVFLKDATAETILDFMSTMSDMMAKGEDISGFFADEAGRPIDQGDVTINTRALKKTKFKNNKFEVKQPIFNPANGKATGFTFIADRMATGEWTGLDPNSGIKIPLMGGIGYPMLKKLYKKAGWAVDGGSVMSTFLNKIVNSKTGIGFPVLMSEYAHVSNLTFAKIFEAEMKWMVKSGQITAEEQLQNVNNYISESLVSKKDLSPKMKEDPKTGKLMDKNTNAPLRVFANEENGKYTPKTYESMDDVYKELEGTFAARAMFMQSMIGVGVKNRYAKIEKYKFPDMIRVADEVSDPRLKGIPSGTSVSAIQFDQKKAKQFSEDISSNQKLSEKHSAKAVGVDPHISYEYVVEGQSLGWLPGISEMSEAEGVNEETKEWYDDQRKKFKEGKISEAQLRSNVTAKSRASMPEVTIKTRAQKAQPQTIPGYDRMIGEAKSIVEKSRKRRVSAAQITENVINYIQGSAVYERADDLQREQIIRDARKELGLRQKSAPSVDRLLGKIKDIKKVTVTEKSALKELLKAEAKGARTAVQARSQAAKALNDILKKLEKKGSIKSTQVRAIMTRYSKVNFFSSSSMDNFVNYMAKVFSDAEYNDKLKTASKTANSVRRLIKNASLQAGTKAIAKKFLDIDPRLVEDIDKYLEFAKALNEAVRTSTAVTVDEDIEVMLKKAIDYNEFQDYMDAQIAAQEEYIKNQLAEIHKDLVDAGVIDASMSLADMKAIIDAIKSDNKDTLPSEEKERMIRAYLGSVMDSYTGLIQYMLDNSMDPFSLELVSISQSDRDIISRFINMDINKLGLKDAYSVVEAIENFIVNKNVDNMGSILNAYEGDVAAETLQKAGTKARPVRSFFSKAFGRAWAEQIEQLQITMERMFGGVNAGIKVMRASGILDISQGKTKAVMQSDKILQKYTERFGKVKNFSSAENIFERKIISFMKRTINGSDIQTSIEFERRKRIIEETIDAMESGSESERRDAAIARKVYDKVLKDAKSPSDVSNSAEAVNNEAVDFWIEEFENIFDELQSVSRSVYNTILERDINYTPDRFTRFDGEVDILDITSSSFATGNESYDLNKSGTLMVNNRIKTLGPKPSRVLSFDFDSDMSNAMLNALIDINTANAIRKVKGFYESESFEKMVGNKEDLNLIKKRVKAFITKTKRKEYVPQSELAKGMKAANLLSQIAVGRALGSLAQIPKQTISVMANTLINSDGKLSFIDVINAKEFIDNSGYSIALRGIASNADVQTINSILERESESNAQEIQRGLNKAAEIWLNSFIARPDVWAARVSWITYYKESLRKQGIDAGNIDWSTHEMNQEAGDYAQAQVNRQQNYSDSDFAGELLGSKDPMKAYFRKVLFPYMTFVFNQKSRQMADIATLSNKAASTEDKKLARKSLAGLAVEMGMYSLVGYFVKEVYAAIVNAITGDEDEEEDKDKRLSNHLKYNSKTIINDLLSPIPNITDAPLDLAINKIMKISGLDEEKFSIPLDQDKSLAEVAIGPSSIIAEGALNLERMSYAAVTGVAIGEYKGKVYERQLSKEDQDLMKYVSVVYGAYLLGGVPADLGRLSEQTYRKLLKNSKKEKGSGGGGIKTTISTKIK